VLDRWRLRILRPILAWDITAAVNKPLFVLEGAHQSSETRIIVGLERIDHCASLDEAGRQEVRGGR